MKNGKIRMSLMAACMLLAASTAMAAPFSFSNEFDTDAIYLYIVDGGRTFNDVLALPSTWDVDVLESNRILMSGSEITAGSGNFMLDILGRGTFVMEWAEMLGGEVNQSGTLRFDRRGNVVSAEYGPITSPVPIPESWWLLGSGLIAFVGIRRRIAMTRG